jgi:hypothetical protein
VTIRFAMRIHRPIQSRAISSAIGSDTGIPTLPGSQWGVTQQTPYSHDVGPLGP